MTTKKKVAAKAAVKAPVRRIKPGPSARKKARAIQSAAASTNALADSAGASAVSAGATSFAALAAAPRSRYDIENEQREADVRLTNAKAYEIELLNQERAQKLGGNVYSFREEAPIPTGALIGADRHIGDEHGQFRNQQDDTDKLLADLHARLEPILRSAEPTAGGGDRANNDEAARNRSPQAQQIASYTGRQSYFNDRLRELLYRLDLPVDAR